MVKKINSVLTALVLSIACYGGTRVSAAQNSPDVLPAYEYAKSCSPELYITGTTAKCVSKVSGYTNVTSIVINQTLQKKISSDTWQFVAHWNETIDGNTGTSTKYKYNLSSGTYRIYTQVTLSTSNDFEVITKYSSSKTL